MGLPVTDDLARIVFWAFEFVDACLDTSTGFDPGSKSGRRGRAYWNLSTEQLRLSKKLWSTLRDARKNTMEEHIAPLIAKREELARGKPFPLMDPKYHENEATIIALASGEDLDEWMRTTAPALSPLIERIREPEQKRTLCALALYMLQSLGAGRVVVEEKPEEEGPTASTTIQVQRDPVAATIEETAKVEERVDLGKGEPVDDGPKWDKVGMAVLSRKWTTVEKAAQAIAKNLGEKKSMPRFADPEMNARRLAQLVERVRAGEVEGWEVANLIEEGKPHQIRLVKSEEVVL